LQPFLPPSPSWFDNVLNGQLWFSILDPATRHDHRGTITNEACILLASVPLPGPLICSASGGAAVSAMPLSRPLSSSNAALEMINNPMKHAYTSPLYRW
jgi:hypothetical protein